MAPRAALACHHAHPVRAPRTPGTGSCWESVPSGARPLPTHGRPPGVLRVLSQMVGPRVVHRCPDPRVPRRSERCGSECLRSTLATRCVARHPGPRVLSPLGRTPRSHWRASEMARATPAPDAGAGTHRRSVLQHATLRASMIPCLPSTCVTFRSGPTRPCVSGPLSAVRPSRPRPSDSSSVLCAQIRPASASSWIRSRPRG